MEGKFFGDVGLLGPDGGKGGKFLLLPPGYKNPVPQGYYVYRSATNNVFIFLRAFYQESKTLASPVTLIEQARIYPLSAKRLRQSLLGSYLGPDFVTEGRSLILYGKMGRGKTHLAIAIGYRALQNGFETFFTTAAELIENLSNASQRGQMQEALLTIPVLML